MSPLLIYIHGFNSSPQSLKAQETLHYLREQQLAVEFVAPDLANYPQQTHTELTTLIKQHANRQVALIGSSMGGFFATVLAEQFGLRAVLINPAVHPHRLIRGYLGHNVNPYSGVHYTLTEEHLQQLASLDVQSLRAPQNLFLLTQTGDETLDYRDAVSYYRNCSQRVVDGGNHRFENYVEHLPECIKFLQL